MSKDQLQDVQDICASRSAFAAVVGDRRHVVTWGDPFNGGDSSEVTHLLEAAGHRRRNFKLFEVSFS